MIRDYSKRLWMHVAAVLAAIATWWIVTDFAAALASSIAVFLVINAVGHLAFGSMPTGEDVRRDVENMLGKRE